MAHANSIKIWTILITRRLSGILHTLTIVNQYGYKQGISTLGAYKKLQNTYEVEGGHASITNGPLQSMRRNNPNPTMDNTIQKGLPLETITHIREGRRHTTLCTKYQGKYGKPEINNISVSQWSEISAILFIIYLDGVMEDYTAINQQAKIHTSEIIQRDLHTGEK